MTQEKITITKDKAENFDKSFEYPCWVDFTDDARRHSQYYLASNPRRQLPLNITMDDLNDNEKYAYLNNSLPMNTYNPKHIKAGDVMLFGDNCLVIFYESFDTSYSYSKIGHINNLPSLDDGNISINIDVK